MKLLRSFLLGIITLSVSQFLTAQTVDLKVEPTAAIETATPKVTWTSEGLPAGTKCTASGGWAGDKAVSGTETLTAIDRSASYVIACVTTTGQAIVSWTPPTQNTNNTALTDLASFNIYAGTTQSNLAKVATAAKTETTKTLTDLSTGTKYFAVTAVNASGVEGAMSNKPSKNIAGVNASDTAAIEVTPRPKPMSGVEVQ